MTSTDRTPSQRTSFLGERLARLFMPRDQMSAQGQLEFDVLMCDVLGAFQAAEERGERRGLLKGQALAKLTDDERSALGLF